ncbi:MAG: heparinase II/III family protein [Flavobacteriia bacterium]|nr:heparinase II/III family protein [Flavobacteriia bacterium]
MRNSYFITLLVLLIASCASPQEKKEKLLKETAVNISLNDSVKYSVNLLEISKSIKFIEIPRTVPNFSLEQIKGYSDKILKDSIVVLHTFKPFYKPLDEITWKENPENNTTWQLYYENLLFVSFLNHTYQDTKDIAYHEQAKKYVNNYISHHPSLDQKTSEYTWYDHATAFRTLHVLQTIADELELDVPDVDFIKRAFDHISLNVIFMTDPAHYSVHNHAIMMDRTLLYLAKITKSNADLSNSLRNLAATRSLDNFNKIIGPTGLAREHSTTYHIFNYNLYKSIFDLIGKENIDPSMMVKYLRMNDILLQLVKPDLKFPLWGDSQIEMVNQEMIEKFGNDKRLRDLTKNYSLPSMVSFENNIATLRTNTPDKGYLCLFANYYSKVHKHNDDLSFIFQTLGTDIFTDQGYYAYDQTYRPQLISALAHNTVVVNNSDYSLDGKDKFSKLISYTREEDYEIVEAEHNFYDGILLRRKIIYIHPNVIIVQDNSDNVNLTKSLTQIFNLGENATDISVNGNLAKASFPNQISLTIQSLNGGDKVAVKDFFRSLSPNKKTDTKQINLETKQSNITSIITIESPKYINPVGNVSVQGNSVTYSKKGVNKKIIGL